MQSSSPWMESLLRWCCLRYWNYSTLSTLFPDSATQPLGFQSGGCQNQLAGTTSHLLLWSFFGSLLVYLAFSFSVVTCLFLHFSKSTCLCLNFPLLRDLMSFPPPLRLLKFFLHFIAPFKVNFSSLLTNDQSAFIQLCTKWNLLALSLSLSWDIVILWMLVLYRTTLLLSHILRSNLFLCWQLAFCLSSFQIK